jgi:hypothetical protein
MSRRTKPTLTPASSASEPWFEKREQLVIQLTAGKAELDAATERRRTALLDNPAAVAEARREVEQARLAVDDLEEAIAAVDRRLAIARQHDAITEQEDRLRVMRALFTDRLAAAEKVDAAIAALTDAMAEMDKTEEAFGDLLPKGTYSFSHRGLLFAMPVVMRPLFDMEYSAPYQPMLSQVARWRDMLTGRVEARIKALREVVAGQSPAATPPTSREAA